MVFRYFCRCQTCGQAHTLRIAMGHSPTQQHLFSCANCGEEMSVDVMQLPEALTCDIKCTLNCEQGNEGGPIINLHPDYPIPEDQLHKDQAFPWLERLGEIIDRQQTDTPHDQQHDLTEDAQRSRLNAPSIAERWKIIKKAWSLTRNNKLDLALDALQKYDMPEADGTIDLPTALFHFCGILLQGQSTLLSGAAELAGEANRRSPKEFHRLRQVHRETWLSEHLDNYYSIFTEYFRDFGEFSQTLLLCQVGLPLGDNDTASSSAFSRTKMFYGNAFEVLTAHFVILACLNNVLNAREYDQFKTMDLKKYLTINKAQRANPFRNIEPFAAFAGTLNSPLRNASHHGAIKINQDRKIIFYRSGGTGSEHQMRYAEYLILCNDHMLKLAALLMLELILAQ